MRPRPAAGGRIHRFWYYAIGGALLLAAVIGLAGRDGGVAMQPDCSEGDLAGSWVFDADAVRASLRAEYRNEDLFPQVERAYGRRVITFAQDTITVDPGDGSAAATRCAIELHRPNFFRVVSGEGRTRIERRFQLVSLPSGRQLFAVDGQPIVPFIRRG